MSGRGLQITGHFIVGEIQKNKTDTIRVTRALLNGTPYVFLAVQTTFNSKDRPYQKGANISLRTDKIDDLIEKLVNARDWLDSESSS